MVKLKEARMKRYRKKPVMIEAGRHSSLECFEYTRVLSNPRT